MEQLTHATIVARYQGSGASRIGDARTCSSTRPSSTFDKGVQVAEIDDPGPRFAAAAVRARPEREADRSTCSSTRPRTAPAPARRASRRKPTRSTRSSRSIPTRTRRRSASFYWNSNFPGADSPVARARSQSRHSFTFIVESVKQKFTFFSPDGHTAARDADADAARVQDARRAAVAAQPELARPHARVRDGAGRHAGGDRRPVLPEARRQWRAIADENDIEDPRRLDRRTRF